MWCRSCLKGGSSGGGEECYSYGSYRRCKKALSDHHLVCCLIIKLMKMEFSRVDRVS